MSDANAPKALGCMIGEATDKRGSYYHKVHSLSSPLHKLQIVHSKKLGARVGILGLKGYIFKHYLSGDPK